MGFNMPRLLYKFKLNQYCRAIGCRENNHMRRILIMATCAAALSCIALVSCTDRGSQKVKLDETPVISGGMGWGVVAMAYVRIMKEPSMTASDIGTARRGDVGRIIARSRSFEDKKTGIWYKMEIGSIPGWLHESSLTVHQSEAEAKKFAEAGL